MSIEEWVTYEDRLAAIHRVAVRGLDGEGEHGTLAIRQLREALWNIARATDTPDHRCPVLED